jgi:hypothetical protein
MMKLVITLSKPHRFSAGSKGPTLCTQEHTPAAKRTSRNAGAAFNLVSNFLMRALLIIANDGLLMFLLRS